MNEEKTPQQSETNAQPVTKVEPQTVEPKPVKAHAPKSEKVSKKAKAPKAKTAKVKATGKDKKVKATAKAKAKKPAKASPKAKVTKAVPQGKGVKIAVPDIAPYRASSSYGKLWTLLYNSRDTGIRKETFLKEGVRITGKPAKNVGFDAAVVISPNKDGSAHPSANRAANHYWVERIGDGLLKLHLR